MCIDASRKPVRKFFMTAEQKAKVVKHAKEKPHMTLEALSLWAFQAMRLPSKPASAMSRAVRQRLDPITLASRPKLKSRKPVHCPRLESDLVEWLRECETFGINVIYQAIKEYAAQLCCTYDDNVKLLFSHGWTSKFLARWRMGRKGVHGQALSVDESVVEDSRAALQALTATYERCDVYNFDETAYFYRLTVAAAVNTDGSDALDLKIIGRSARLDDLEHFRRVAQNVHRIDGRAGPSSHKLPEALSNFKKKIQRRKTKYVLTKFEEIRRFHKAAGTVPSRQEIAEMHKVDMESAIEWAKEAWSEVESSTISNCWRHTNILGDAMEKLAEGVQSAHLNPTSIHFITH
ncbi:hypothetical protein DYB32_009754 [Aphanomyces invadans]|uniref:HTH CENPB-type domain-containing protein n=1 Tax=Aphanomyces invadans TaxID=157072 RepID=A0A418AHW1_9STRA|nr:hypothetical protein DYB32_009754 [Aphanomyces invadans]